MDVMVMAISWESTGLIYKLNQPGWLQHQQSWPRSHLLLQVLTRGKDSPVLQTSLSLRVLQGHAGTKTMAMAGISERSRA